jgi:hypothetical protein
MPTNPNRVGVLERASKHWCNDNLLEQGREILVSVLDLTPYSGQGAKIRYKKKQQVIKSDHS